MVRTRRFADDLPMVLTTPQRQRHYRANPEPLQSGTRTLKQLCEERRARRIETRSDLPLAVDTSVVAAALFDEPQRLDSSEALDGAEAHTPDLLDHELVSIALQKQRAGLGDAVRDS
ncbi:MAG: hypothetical protein KF911_01810 [Pseudomonadales bacterium]|nr:hypothetical protein [Pseudomonadales bacterium]